MAKYDNLGNIKAEITKCMKCGNCQAVCPIYKELFGESGVARGKIQIAKELLEGRLEYTDKLKEIFELCLTCKACAANCPCGVKPDEIILATRAALVRKKGLPALKRYIFGALSKPKRFRMGMGMAAKFQAFGLKKVDKKELVKARLPIGIDKRRVVRPLANKSLLTQMPENNRVVQPRAKVAFFTGCMLNYIYTDAGHAVVQVLNANDVDVILPKKQHCCGIPVFINGDMETAKEIARYNIDIFSAEKYDAIITHCGTCIGAWAHHYQELLADDPEYGTKAKELAEKSFDVSQYLIDHIGIKEPVGEMNYRVTYHDPCHMVRGVGISDQPRQVVKSIPGIELVEMKKPDRCCGMAGSFSLSHYNLSSRIRDKKIDDALAAKPELVLTSCGACRMQLEDGLYQAGSDIPVKYVAEILAEAYSSERGAAIEREIG